MVLEILLQSVHIMPFVAILTGLFDVLYLLDYLDFYLFYCTWSVNKVKEFL